MFNFEKQVFSKNYRSMIRNLKTMVRRDRREEEKLYDIRTSTGKGRQGSADVSHSVSKSRHTRRSSGKESGPTDNEAEKDRNTGTASSDVSHV